MDDDLYWRPDAPPSVALVASSGDANFVLASIGIEWEYLSEVKSVNDWVTEVMLDPGIWMVDIAPSTTVEYHTDCGTDYDIEMNVGDIRKATTAEVMAHGNDEYPWDPALWINSGHSVVCP